MTVVRVEESWWGLSKKSIIIPPRILDGLVETTVRGGQTHPDRVVWVVSPDVVEFTFNERDATQPLGYRKSTATLERDTISLIKGPRSWRGRRITYHWKP